MDAGCGCRSGNTEKVEKRESAVIQEKTMNREKVDEAMAKAQVLVEALPISSGLTERSSW